MPYRYELFLARREYRKADATPDPAKRGKLRRYWRKRCDELVSLQSSIRPSPSAKHIHAVSKAATLQTPNAS